MPAEIEHDSPIERNRCPDEFQRLIAEAGGRNKYDEPNFRLVWGQTETFRAGGEWAGNGQIPFTGYRDLLIGMGDPCWILQQWMSPESYGTPESYYVQNYDPDTGFQILGEYPYAGRYETILPLISKQVVGDVLVVEHMKLSSLLIDLVVPVIRANLEISNLKRQQQMLEYKEWRRERDNAEQVAQIEASLANAYPAFGTASRSASRLACNSVVQKRAEQMELYWKDAVKLLRNRGKGLSVGPI